MSGRTAVVGLSVVVVVLLVVVAVVMLTVVVVEAAVVVVVVVMELSVAPIVVVVVMAVEGGTPWRRLAVTDGMELASGLSVTPGAGIVTSWSGAMTWARGGVMTWGRGGGAGGAAGSTCTSGAEPGRGAPSGCPAPPPARPSMAPREGVWLGPPPTAMRRLQDAEGGRGARGEAHTRAHGHQPHLKERMKVSKHSRERERGGRKHYAPTSHQSPLPHPPRSLQLPSSPQGLPNQNFGCAAFQRTSVDG